MDDVDSTSEEGNDSAGDYSVVISGPPMLCKRFRPVFLDGFILVWTITSRRNMAEVDSVLRLTLGPEMTRRNTSLHSSL